MDDSVTYVELLKKIAKNKYKLVQEIIEKGEMLSNLSPDYAPFYSEDCLMKVSKEILHGTEEGNEEEG